MEIGKEVPAALASLALVFLGAVWTLPAAEKLSPAPSAADSPPPLSSPLPAAEGSYGGGPTLRLLRPDGTVAQLELEDYVQGVLTAEMPAAFQSAALEAQAVAARTYALHRARAGVHAPQADVCADSACCQAYAAQSPESWGSDAPFYTAKLRAAVQATAGQVLYYDGSLIEAAYHASSDGLTADARSVWGSERPYLTCVSTPESAETVPRFQQEAAFSPGELEEKLGSAELGAVTYHPWGGVATLEVGGQALSGEQVRGLLGLRSARFQIERRGEQTVFVTTGYGHGVGMSQYGAQLMAQEGADYRAILAHYYPGTELGEA